jgi:hypothetical protein
MKVTLILNNLLGDLCEQAAHLMAYGHINPELYVGDIEWFDLLYFEVRSERGN